MKNLTQDRWLQIDNLFEQVLEKSFEKRPGFLDDACESDVELRDHVEKLLQVHDEAGQILGDSACSFAAPLITKLIDETAGSEYGNRVIGSFIGSYEIIDIVGHGGMGTVYLAKKTVGSCENNIALKLIRRGIDSKDMLRYFLNEGKILAILDHPNIVQLYDGGIHKDGRPFFVMEYVSGEPIDSYCQSHKLSIEKILILFKTVCESVDYVHQNYIVHMDIKPSNILITQDGRVKLVDFGIAKFLERVRIHCDSTFKRPGMRLMTPDFASPEQIQGKSITTVSDVYSLGVLLYSLITGRRPFYFGYSSVSEIINIISKTKPILPSDLTSGKTFPPQPGQPEERFNREYSARCLYKNMICLRKELTDDLDRIVLKALRIEPEMRFHSAYQFAEEIDHYLQKIPVSTQYPTL